ncbi:hypothetical protein SAMN05421753_108131 [Planctomicrobium piriforme]|uniref:Anti-sigma-28 factor, FlgM n=1 Tax=Planctomicrobium piriforme TaxID=1576369 RepID=A0A1I3HNL1_9PLAN|nr:hypothetical protein SAMN05421753_108131 [Planctomicrobium piriforme]
MQVRRFDHEPHAFAQTRGTVRPQAEQIAEGSATSNSQRIDQSTTRTEDSQLASLIEGTRSFSDIRSDAVEAAREKVAQGHFATRESAEQLAATELRNEYF